VTHFRGLGARLARANRRGRIVKNNRSKLFGHFAERNFPALEEIFSKNVSCTKARCLPGGACVTFRQTRAVLNRSTETQKKNA